MKRRRSVPANAEGVSVATATTLGERIRAYRRSLDLSQEALAQPEFTKSYVSAVERNRVRPSLKALEAMARRLGVSTSVLLQESTAAKEEPLALLGQAEASILAGQAAAALSLLDQPLADLEAARFLLRAQAFLQSSDWNQAADAARLALENTPDTAAANRIHTALGDALSAQGRALEALEQHRQGLPAEDGAVSEVAPVQAGSALRLLADYVALGDSDSARRLVGQSNSDLQNLLGSLVKRYAQESAAAFAAADNGQGRTRLAQAQALNDARDELLLLAQGRLQEAVSGGEEPGKSERDLSDIMLLADLAGSQDLVAQAVLQKAQLALTRDDIDLAAQYAAQAHDLQPQGAVAVRAQVISGKALAAHNRTKESDAVMLAALKDAEQQSNADLLSEVAATFADMHIARGDHKSAAEYYQLAWHSADRVRKAP